MPHNHIVLFNNRESREMVKRLCMKYEFVFEVFEELIQAEINQDGGNRYRLWQDFDDILDRIMMED